MTLQKIKIVEKTAHGAVYTYYQNTTKNYLFILMLFQASSFSDMPRQIFFGFIFFLIKYNNNYYYYK